MGIIETLTSHWGFSVLAVLAVVIILCATLGKVEEDKLSKPVGVGACGLFIIVLGVTCTTLNTQSIPEQEEIAGEVTQTELPEELKDRPKPVIDYLEDMSNITDVSLENKVKEVTQKLDSVDFTKYNETVNRHGENVVSELNQAGDAYNEEKTEETQFKLVIAINQTIDFLTYEVTDENLIK